MRKLLALAVSLVAVIAAGVSAQYGDPFGGQPGGLSMGRVSIALAWRETPIAAGTTSTSLGVVLNVVPGWHLQAGEGSGDHKPPYIATTVSVELPEGWTAGAAKWPEAHAFTLGAGEYAETLRGYEGRSTITLPIEIPPGAAPGTYPFAVTVGYQACDDQVCEAPTQQKKVGEVVIAAAAGAAGDDDAAGDDAIGDDERVELALAVYEGQFVPGRTANVGVVFDVNTFWHVQAGAGSGDEIEPYIATQVALALPEGWTAGDVQWPAAHAFTFGEGEFAEDLKGYEEQFAAVVPVDVPEDAAAGAHEITATVTYQACDDMVCEMPQTRTLALSAQVVTDAAAAADGELDPEIAQAIERTLRSGDAAPAGATDGAGKEPRDLGHLLLAVQWWTVFAFVAIAMLWLVVRTFGISKKTIARALVTVLAAAVLWASFAFVRSITTAPDDVWTKYSAATFQQARADNKRVFIKFTANWCANCQVNERMLIADDAFLAEVRKPDVVALKVDFSGPNPEGDVAKDAFGGGGIPLIGIYHPGVDDGIAFRGQLVSTTPVVEALQGLSLPQVDEARQSFDLGGWQFDVSKGAVALILALAFVAGFLMNFTPCVLPVIPLKILSLQAHAKHPGRCLFLGLVFGLGIVALYAVLGVAMAWLGLDWGEHFKIPWVSIVLGLVVGVMALGMLGLFSIRLPQFLYAFNPQGDTASSSFFMGIFTAVLSTPCTGPLFGAAVAWSATQPPLLAFVTLVVMGLGMAFPYVLLTAKPSWLARLPRTGPGSELVKQVMGLLLIAVCAWFVMNGISGIVGASA